MVIGGSGSFRLRFRVFLTDIGVEFSGSAAGVETSPLADAPFGPDVE